MHTEINTYSMYYLIQPRDGGVLQLIRKNKGLS